MMITAALLRANPDEAEGVLQSIAEEKGLDYAQRVAAMAFPGSAQERELSHFEKAKKLFGAQYLAEALEEYKLAIAVNRDHAGAYMGAGDCYYHLGQLNLAAAFFEESVAIQPSPSTLRFLGDAHRRAGRMEKAIQAYEQALELDPSYELVTRQLHIIQEHMKEASNA